MRVVNDFFMHLSRHEYDAAADLLRADDGTPISVAERAGNVAGWRRAYDGHTVNFTRVVVRRIPFPVEAAVLARAGATEGHVESVHFEGSSDSPCVPVNNEVIPGTSQPVAIRTAAGWFLLASSMVGFIATCPGA